MYWSNIRIWIKRLVKSCLSFTVFAGARLSCLFQAWQMISIAVVQSITNASPVLVMILSHIILDDRMTLIKCLCCIGYIIGVLCIFQLVESVLAGNMVRLLDRNFIYGIKRDLVIWMLINIKFWIKISRYSNLRATFLRWLR